MSGLHTLFVVGRIEVVLDSFGNDTLAYHPFIYI